MKLNWKSLLSSTLAVTLVLGLAGSAMATQGKASKNLDYANISVTLNDKKLDLKDAKGAAVEPFAIDGTTYLPVRAIGDAMGLYVDWDKANSKVVLSENPIHPSSGITDGTVNFYMVRHGKTIMNTLDLVQGWSDSPLTAAGVNVAKNAAVGMSDIVFDYAHASDRGRAIETAEIILSESKNSSGLKLVTHAGLRENNFGGFEGVPNQEMWGEIAKYHKVADLMDLLKDPNAPDPFACISEIDKSGTAETHEVVVARLTKSVNDIAAEVAAKGGGNVLLVGHGAALGTVIGELAGDDAVKGQLDNASVSKIVYKDGKYTAETVGDMSYAKTGEAARAQSEQPLTVYLTRHGKTFFNTVERVQGWIDSPLTEDGAKVATDLGKGLADVDFSGVYTSGLGRTVETAQLVMAGNKTGKDLPLVSNTGIRETNYGKYEGKTFAEVMAACTKHYGISDVSKLATKDQSFIERYLQFTYETDETGAAENLFEVRARVSGALDEICQEASENGGGNILVVSHGNAIGAILEELGAEVKGEIPNASVTKITYQNGTYKVETVGDLSYVEAGAKK